MRIVNGGLLWPSPTVTQQHRLRGLLVLEADSGDPVSIVRVHDVDVQAPRPQQHHPCTQGWHLSQAVLGKGQAQARISSGNGSHMPPAPAVLDEVLKHADNDASGALMA